MSKQSLGLGLPAALDSCCAPISTAPLNESRAVELAEMFRALADPVRLRLVSLISSAAGGEVCVCELTPHFDVSQPTISHHLKVLREAGLIESERRGTWVYYSITPGALAAIAAIFHPAQVPA